MYAVLDDSLITGNKLIDSQHAELITKINDLLKVCENSSGKLEAVRMLGYLMDYTEFHFAAEEKLQEEGGYPGLKEHKAKHEAFKVAVQELSDMLDEQEGPTDEFVAAVKKNVVDWLYDHIKGFDCSVATYLNMHDYLM